MSTGSAPIAVDLFAGAGGLSEGLLAAGIDVAVAVERHPHPALTHAFNHAGTTVLCGDLRQLSAQNLLAAVKKRTGQKQIDVIAGGPPCQGFSCAGKQDRNDPRNQLVNHFIRIVEYCKPRMFIFENVPGFAQFDEGLTIHKVLDEFWRIGYRMHGIDNDSEFYPEAYPIVNSALHNVPQMRRRFILIGWRPNQLSKDLAWSPEASPRPSLGRDKNGFGQVGITVREAIGDLEFLPGGMESHEYMLAPTSAYQRSRRVNTDVLFNHLATKHRPDTVRRFRRIGSGKTINSVAESFRSGKQRMTRFAADGVASAVLALPDDYVHYSRHRIPTVRELARLQSFDDDYVFLGKRTTSDSGRQIDVPQYTQVGNAVPPLLAKSIGTSIVRALGGKCTDLRSLATRRERHRLLRGSSGFQGYALTAEAIECIRLTDLSGKPLGLPLADNESVLITRAKLQDWTSKSPRRRSPRAAHSGQQ